MYLTEITFGFFIITFSFFIGLLYLYFKNKRNADFLYASLFFLCSAVFLFGQFQLTYNTALQRIVFWDKFQYLGIFGFLYTVPLLSVTVTQKRLSRSISLGLGVLTIITLGLIAFTNIMLANQTRLYPTTLRADRGILFFPFLAILVFVCIYFYIQIINASRKEPVTLVNYTPLIVGIGIGIFCGLLDVVGFIRNREMIQGASWPFILVGVFIVSITFAWTFLSKYSWFFSALTESQLENEKLIEKYDRNFVEFVHLIAKTLDAKDHYTAGHALRVMDYSMKIASALTLPESMLSKLEQAALLHDIGKISIPDGILNKRTPLTKKEREYINRHPAVAKQILSTVSDFRSILDIIYNHHERVDGKGYPNGRTKSEIPLLSKILSVADAYDAMRSERPYRRARTKVEAVDELRRVKGTQLDEEIVETFIEIVAA